MRDNEALLLQLERIIHKYNQKEASKHDYGSGMMLTQSEIHLIAAIGDAPGIGVKKLAQLKGVTDGAVSQMLRKLVQKGLIHKTHPEESEAKVSLNLTDAGRLCYNEHQRYHIVHNRKWHDLFNTLDEHSYQSLTTLLFEAEEILSHEIQL